MAPATLEGDTLGEKRQHYNKLVKDAIANKDYDLSNINDDDSDIDNLLKIDIASRNRNVDYIIEVMKSKDMLYAATAIKKSTWLITEQQYANIINPEYLHTQLLPSMNTKTFNKLMLHIRLNLKDETRVEAFYEYLKQTDSGYKWLQNCSIPFIENVVKNEGFIPLSLFKRLCKRSVNFLSFYTRVEPNSMCFVKKEILFLLKSHTEDVLNVVEDTAYDYYPVIGKKKTKFIMKTCPERILNKIDRYCYNIDLSILPQYLNKEEIKPFLYKHAKNNMFFLCHYETLKHFINNMPVEERFEFVRKTFINKTELAAFYPEYDRENMNQHIKSYQWYEYAPFNVALTELKKLIRKENLPSERIAMLSILITCARKNSEHIKSLLKFVKEKHINEPFKFKIQFVNNLLSHIATHEFDVETWNVLDQLFHSIEVYTESDNNVQLCLESIILYKVLHDDPVPEIVEQKMDFNSFVKIQNKLNQEQNEKIFTYLLNFYMKKVSSKNIANDSDFSETVLQLKNVLTLLKDRKKDISKYPSVQGKIQELIKIKQQNMWKTDMSCLYNIKKSWRKHMFEESLSLCLCEETCLNALKHKPQLLTRHDKEIDTLRTNDAVSLRRLLAKLRVYWPHSLAQHWTDAYLQNLNKPSGQKAVVRGLFMLLSQNQVIDMAKKYIPEDFKINWGETDQADISIRKNIAKNLHVARPLIPLDTILWYAKGDYLQHAVPSLNAILSNLSEVKSREHVPILLEAPVSLQKFGIYLVFYKLKYDDQKSMFFKILSTSNSPTIPSILFKHTYSQICNVKNPNLEKDLWELLSTSMDRLSSEESTDVYNLISSVQNVPISVRAEYYMKSYSFLTSLPTSSNCEKYIEVLLHYAPKIMESLDENFVVDKLLSPAGPKFCSLRSKFIKIFACYILCGKNQKDQLQRFRRVVDPAMEEAFQIWDSVHLDCYFIKKNFNKFLKALVWNFRKYYVTLKTIPIPAELFVEIQTKIENNLSLADNYILYTSWKLTTEYFKLMNEFSSSSNPFESSNFSESDFGKGWMSNDIEKIWKNIHDKISPTLGSIIVKRLKEDIEQYSCTTIYCPFTDAFEKLFEKLSFSNAGFVLETLKHMLNDCDFISSYLVVSKAIPKFCAPEFQSERTEIRKKIESHPSTTVRIHYYSIFHAIPKDVLNNPNS